MSGEETSRFDARAAFLRGLTPAAGSTCPEGKLALTSWRDSYSSSGLHACDSGNVHIDQPSEHPPWEMERGRS